MHSKKHKIKEGTPPVANPSLPSAQPVPHNANGDPGLKEESMRWLFSVVAYALTYFAIAKVVLTVYHPDTTELTRFAKAMFFDVDLVSPEPMEAMLFRIAVLLVGPGLIGFYALFPKLPLLRKLTEDVPYRIISALSVAALFVLIYAGFAAANPFGKKGIGKRPENNRDTVGLTNFDFFFDGLITGNYIWVYALVIVPLVVALFYFGIKRKKLDANKFFRSAVLFIGYTVMAYAIVAIVLMNIISFPYTDENKFDFNAVYYSMTQVHAGIPMLVDGFTNTYGLYPHFLAPIFQLVGLNVLKFTTVMSLLLGAAFVLNFVFMRAFVRNRIILFLGFATVVFFPYLNFRLLTIFDCLFSLHPIRYLVPTVLCCLATLYFTRRTHALYWVTFFTSAASVLWNPELGVVCYLSWVVALVYSDYYDSDRSISFKKMGRHLVFGISVFFAVFIAYKVFIYIVYGAWPSMSLLFSTMAYFGKYGMNLLPMVLLHPWNLTAIVLILGFLYSISKWYNKEITPRSTMVLIVSLISVGYFTYFQGRSQNSNFSLSSGFTLILLTLLIDELWEKIRENNLLLLNGAFAAGMLILTFSFFEIALNSEKINALIYQEDDRQKHVVEQNEIDEETEFIAANSAEKEKILIYCLKKYQGLLFEGRKRRSGFNPGFMDMFLRSDLAKMEQTVIDSSFSIFIMRDRRVYPYLNRSHAAIAATYEFSKPSKKFAMLVKRKRKLPTATFFANRDKMVLHRKYTDDSAGIERRIADAVAGLDVGPDTSFSVEVLYYSQPQVFRNPTLIGNLNGKDTCGFAVGKMPESDNKYYFGINGAGVKVGLPFEKWIYAVMNVYPGFIEVFINGQLVVRQETRHIMRKSKMPVLVGAFSDYHYYIGAISEVCVSNRLVDSGSISETWMAIDKALPK